MTTLHELIVSARDAQVLGLMLGERRHDPAAARALKDLLLEARIVAHEELPWDRVAMSSKVTYEELPRGERRRCSSHRWALRSSAAARARVARNTEALAA